MGKEETDPLVGDHPTKDKKDDKDGDKEKKPKDKWPTFSTRKVKKNTLEAGIVACYRLEAAQNMQFHARMGFAVAIVVHLITQIAQVFILIVFNAATANAMVNAFSPANVKMMISGVKQTLMAAENQPVGGATAYGRSCARQRSHPWLGYLMMFLWWSMMIKEVIDCCEILKLIVQFPASKPKDPSKKKGEKKKVDPNKELENDSFKIMGKDKEKINHMAFRWKLFAIIFILLPHIGCSLFIGYVGMKFLAMTGDPGRLIMKAMGLKFILGFDKLFYLAFTSEQFDRYFKHAKYQWVRPKERNYFNSWLSTLFKMAVAVMLTGIAWTQFKHMMKLRHYCRLYMDMFPANCLGDTCGMSFR